MRPVYKAPERRTYYDDYTAARRLLIQTIGGYCSYCEAPISVDVPVEHKVAKSTREVEYQMPSGSSIVEITGFPLVKMKWLNLLLACSACNSAKGARPDRNDARNYLYQTGGSYGTGDEELLFLSAIRCSVWPDSTPQMQGQPAVSGDQTYRLFSYSREPLSQVYLAELGYLRALSPVDATKDWATALLEKVWVMPNLDYIQAQNDPMLLERVKTTLQILQLNHYNAWDSKASDRRTENRTLCHETAERSLADLAETIGSGSWEGVFPLLIPAIRQVALATGFWSVWMQVFVSAFQSEPWSWIPTETKNAMLSALFLESPPFGSGRLIFPGTDLSRIYS